MSLECVHLPYTVDSGIWDRVRLGFVVLANDQTLSYELHKLLDIPGVAIFESRQEVRSYKILNKEELAAQKGFISQAAKNINALYPPDVVGYGCTSGAMMLGNDGIAEEVHKFAPDAKVTNPLLAGIEALKVLKIKKLAFISPYIQEVNEGMIQRLNENGIDVAVTARFFMDDRNPSKDAPFVDADSIEKAIFNLDKEFDFDAVFISCTQMRFVSRIEEVEKKLGKPVITSNLALCWHVLRLAGCQDVVEGYGELFKKPIS